MQPIVYVIACPLNQLLTCNQTTFRPDNFESFHVFSSFGAFQSASASAALGITKGDKITSINATVPIKEPVPIAPATCNAVATLRMSGMV